MRRSSANLWSAWSSVDWPAGCAAGRPPERVDYARLLGPAAWSRLPAAVRDRFALERRREVVYLGRMACVRASAFGLVLAWLGRLAGGPLVPCTGRDVPACVRVYEEADGGCVWERAYQFPGRATRTVRSAKRLDADGTLLECLGLGLHMRLALGERGGALEFRSLGYFWRVLGLRVPLPRRWFPGETVVTHRDQGDGRFRFTLSIDHPLLGRIVEQDGIFIEREALP